MGARFTTSLGYPGTKQYSILKCALMNVGGCPTVFTVSPRATTTTRPRTQRSWAKFAITLIEPDGPAFSWVLKCSRLGSRPPMHRG
jgi:hypothetical protein